MRHPNYNVRYSVVPRDSLLLTVTLHSSVRTTLVYIDTGYSVHLLLLLLLLLLLTVIDLSLGGNSPYTSTDKIIIINKHKRRLYIFICMCIYIMALQPSQKLFCQVYRIISYYYTSFDFIAIQQMFIQTLLDRSSTCARACRYQNSLFFQIPKNAENQEMSAKCNIFKPFALLFSLDSKILNTL